MSRERKRRAKCRWCGVTKSLTKDGRLRQHMRRTDDPRNPTARCGGSGQRPV
ncbi:MAG TPA: hypothetical protein VH136_18580 [Trebonia sp.]|jgi:hypothetical protein|nr:hypothetical protein [Trebonia sp.]